MHKYLSTQTSVWINITRSTNGVCEHQTLYHKLRGRVGGPYPFSFTNALYTMFAWGCSITICRYLCNIVVFSISNTRQASDFTLIGMLLVATFIFESLLLNHRIYRNTMQVSFLSNYQMSRCGCKGLLMLLFDSIKASSACPFPLKFRVFRQGYGLGNLKSQSFLLFCTKVGQELMCLQQVR